MGPANSKDMQAQTGRGGQRSRQQNFSGRNPTILELKRQDALRIDNSSADVPDAIIVRLPPTTAQQPEAQPHTIRILPKKPRTVEVQSQVEDRSDEGMNAAAYLIARRQKLIAKLKRHSRPGHPTATRCSIRSLGIQSRQDRDGKLISDNNSPGTGVRSKTGLPRSLSYRLAGITKKSKHRKLQRDQVNVRAKQVGLEAIVRRIGEAAAFVRAKAIQPIVDEMNHNMIEATTAGEGPHELRQRMEELGKAGSIHRRRLNESLDEKELDQLVLSTARAEEEKHEIAGKMEEYGGQREEGTPKDEDHNVEDDDESWHSYVEGDDLEASGLDGLGLDVELL